MDSTGPSLLQTAPDVKKRRKPSTKTRTGCLTCRRRRIKCDENKPICNRCKISGGYCGGSLYQDTPTFPSSVKATNERGWELAPKGWEVVEACEYYNFVLQPSFGKTFMDVDDEDSTDSTGSGPHLVKAAPDIIAAQVVVLCTLANRISVVSAANGIGFRPSKEGGTYHMWHRFNQAMEKVLFIVNRDLANVAATTDNAVAARRVIRDSRILEKIADIVTFGSKIDASGWLAHSKGYFSLLNVKGKPREYIHESDKLWCSMLKMIAYCTLANSVAAPSKSIKVLYTIESKDAITVFAHESSSVFLCPSLLFGAIFSVTRIRTYIEATSPWHTDTATKACMIFDHIQSFDPAHWEEKYVVPDRPEVYILARVLKLAVGLFTLMSLKMDESERGRECLLSHNLDKLILRERLLFEIRESTKYPKCLEHFIWPLTVLCVAYADGPVNLKLFLMQYFADIGASRSFMDGQERHTVSRIIKFWDGGKTGWDDCWDEPYIM